MWARQVLEPWYHEGTLAQPRLLQMLIGYWDLDVESFNLDGQPPKILVDDINFIIVLPRRGEIVKLRAWGAGGRMTVEEYIIVYWIPDTKKIRSQVQVNVIQSLSLKVIVLVLERISGLESLHQDSRTIMFYLLECMRAMVYDWSTALLRTMKKQLTNYELGRIKNFRYGNILSTFFFNRVSNLIPIYGIHPIIIGQRWCRV